MLRCHIQSLNPRLLLANFDSLLWILAQFCSKLGYWQSLMFEAFHSVLLPSFLDPRLLLSQHIYFHSKGFSNACSILG
jgi:hypothetical protein